MVTLIEDAALADADTSQLYATIVSLSTEIKRRNTHSLIAALRTALLNQEILDARTVRFDVEEWENGFFFDENAMTVLRVEGQVVTTSDEVMRALGAAVAADLTEVSNDIRFIGRHNYLVVDLTAGTVTEE